MNLEQFSKNVVLRLPSDIKDEIRSELAAAEPDWERIFELIMELIEMCEDMEESQFVRRAKSPTLWDRVAFRVRGRRFWREEGVDRPGRVSRAVTKAIFEEAAVTNVEDIRVAFQSAKAALGA